MPFFIRFTTPSQRPDGESSRVAPTFRSTKTASEVNVTIRFVGYASTDCGLAKQIESILQQDTSWKITLDGSNNPALRPNDEYKVIFESAMTGTFREVAVAFSEGRLIDAPIRARDHVNRFDQERLVVEVLPTAS